MAAHHEVGPLEREPLRHAISLCRHDLKSLMVSVPFAGPSVGADGSTRYLVTPLVVDQDAVGVLVVGGLAPGASMGALLSRLGYLPETIALNVERGRALAALDRRGDELTALRQQLDAFAVDFRSTYQAERDRSQQLAGALAELERTYRSTVGGLAMAVEAKDECTGGHLYRVSRYGMLVTADGGTRPRQRPPVRVRLPAPRRRQAHGPRRGAQQAGRTDRRRMGGHAGSRRKRPLDPGGHRLPGRCTRDRLLPP